MVSKRMGGGDATREEEIKGSGCSQGWERWLLEIHCHDERLRGQKGACSWGERERAVGLEKGWRGCDEVGGGNQRE